MVECGSTQVAIGKGIGTRTTAETVEVLNTLFLERGPVDEPLMDNSRVFRSPRLNEMLDQ